MMPKTKRTDNFQGGLEILSMVFTHMHTYTYTGTHTCTNPTQRERGREKVGGEMAREGEEAFEEIRKFCLM